MNLKITLPAIASLAAFLATMLVLNQSDGQQPQEAAARLATASSSALIGSAASPALDSSSESPSPAAAIRAPARLTQKQAKAMLETMTASYTKPWQEYSNSPHHMMSRVAPRPVPSLNTHIEWASSSEADGLLLATIRITKGLETTAAPCVIDCEKKQVRIFANDQWLSGEDWVKTAPKLTRQGFISPEPN
jgi:hypothetical protein